MSKQLLEEYIHEHIPITQALGVKIAYASAQEIIVSAPFSNNINHKKTVFGGSLHTITTLACWALLYENFKDSIEPVEIVVRHSEINYLHPVTTDFKAQCLIPENGKWLRFLKILTSKNRARIHLRATIYQEGVLAVDYQGTFAVIKRNNKSQ